MRRLLIPAGVAVAVTLALTASTARAALAAQPTHFRFVCSTSPAVPESGCPMPSDEFLPSEHCGIPGTTVDTQWGNVQTYADGSAMMEVRERYTFTSDATGKSFESFSSAQQTQSAPIESSDGKTVTILFTFKGLEQQLKLANGRVLVRDVGPITFTLVLDAATGDFISFSASEKQPHAIFDTGGADGAAYCAAIVPALS